MTLLMVTGGCGFIGSNFVRFVLGERPGVRVRVVDLLTYAGNLQNLEDQRDDRRLEFHRLDIADRAAMMEAAGGVDAIINFAAESHVDRSILDATPFLRTNVTGTQVLLEAARATRVQRYLQISTDEVYGSLGPSGKFTETTPLAPNSPYSASKAAADLMVQAYMHTHGTPATILRSSNAYGPYQFPEKLIPLMVTNALAGEPLPVYGDGMQVRDWVHVLDLCRAILDVLERGEVGQTYNVGGGNELPNVDVVRMILELTGARETLVRHVPDRPGHDRRYAMDHTRITRALGWQPTRQFREGLQDTVRWYVEHGAWVQTVKSGGYRDYYERQYRSRLAGGDAAPARAGS